MTKPQISQAELDETPLVCFVCTGNTCRSPMAAAVLNDLANREKLPFRAVSAGFFVTETEISSYAADALEDAGIPSTPDNPYRLHIPRKLNDAIATSCVRLIGVTSAHAMELLVHYPQYAGKISALSQDIFDPYGGDAACYRRCLAEITKAVKEEFFHGHS